MSYYITVYVTKIFKILYDIFDSEIKYHKIFINVLVYVLSLIGEYSLLIVLRSVTCIPDNVHVRISKRDLCFDNSAFSSTNNYYTFLL